MKLNWNTATLFLVVAVAAFLFAIIEWLFLGNTAIDIQLHDTMFVIAHAHFYLAFFFIFVLFSLVYYAYPLLFNRYMNEMMGKVHFVITVAGLLLVFSFSWYAMARPRQYRSYQNFETLTSVDSLTMVVGVAMLLVITVQALFVFNIFYSLFRGKKRLS